MMSSSASSIESRPQELLPPDAANLDEDFIDMLLNLVIPSSVLVSGLEIE
jgi:hypothetical protein